MARIQITIRAEAPLSLGTTKSYGGTLIESAQYISGAHLRGALGSIKPYLSSAQQSEIDQILGTPQQRGINFPNCYPNTTGLRFNIPATAQTCKRKGIEHGVTDTLLMQLAYDRVARADNQWHIPLPFLYRCHRCGHRTENYSPPGVSTHRQTRVAINRVRMTAEEGQLYSVQAIDEGTTFVGLAEINEARLQTVQNWIGEIGRLGGRTSRGFGRVRVQAQKVTSGSTVRERLKSFNDNLRKFEGDLSAIALDHSQPDEAIFFTINLHADALLYTLEGIPTLKLNVGMLHEAFDALLMEQERKAGLLEQLALRFVAQHTTPKRVSGWQTLWQLPKEVSLASRMGGFYVFAADTGRDNSRQEFLISLLERLEAVGIGEKREDGYGQIVICDPFHLEVNQAYESTW
jgi:CRISPR-associated protein Csx10